jgi:hypothetical protein
MAGPSVAVRVFADLTNFAKSMADAGTHAEQAAGKMHAAFSATLGALNQTGVLGPFGAALDGVDQALETISKHGKDVGLAMIGVGGAIAGIGVGLSALGSKDQAAHQQLQAAVKATGQDYDDYAKQVDQAIKHQENFGHSANQTEDALRILTEATGDFTKGSNLLATAADLAAAKHEDLATAATQVGKVYNGNTKLLKEFGVAGEKAVDTTSKMEAATKAAQAADDKAAQAKQNLADLTARLGAGTQAATVSTGGLETAQRSLADAQQHLVDVQTALAGKTTLTQADQIRLRDAHQAVQRATEGVTTAHETYAAAIEKANGKAGLSVAQSQQLKNAQDKVSAATAAATDAHKKLGDMHTTVIPKTQAAADNVAQLGKVLSGQASASADTFMGRLDAIKAKLEDTAASMGQKYGPAVTAVGSLMAGLGSAWSVISAIMAADWFAAFWPVALIVVAIAGVGVAIYLMRDKFVEVFQWIEKNWPLLVEIIVGPFGVAAVQIYQHWDAILGFFRRTVGDVAAIGADIWNALFAGFRAAVDAFATVWNDTLGAVHFKIPSWVPGGLGGHEFGFPEVPHLAQGGLITQTGLIYAHAGEAITPMPAGGLGPAVHIENATFTDQADLDMLFRQASFAVSAGRM